MTPLPGRVLIIDEDAVARRAMGGMLGTVGLQAVEVSSGRAALHELQHWTPDCVLLDLATADVPALQLLAAIASGPSPRPPVVVIGARPTMEAAVEAMKLGAKDVLGKPLEAATVQQAVLAAIQRGELARDVARLETHLATLPQTTLVAHSPAMSALVEKLDRLASVEMTVLIVGERGSGTASVARHMHAMGPRSNKPMVVVPDSDAPGVAAQVLFGGGGRPSAFAQAGDGVLFIESLESLGASGQERLAAVLSELSAARASGQPLAFPRLLVAAQRELPQLVELGEVKEELARRLSPLTIQVPSLKNRRLDIPELVAQIASRASQIARRPPVSFDPEVITFFQEQPWPGNLDQLESVLVRAIALAREGHVKLEDLSPPRPAPQPQPMEAPVTQRWLPTDPEAEVLSFDKYEAEIFRFALDRAGGCVSRAAELLGVGRATMYRKMRSYGLDVPPVSERAIVRSGRRRPAPNEHPTSDAHPVPDGIQAA